MKEYIIYQVIVCKEELIGNNNNIEMNCIVRKVKAKSEEEAIGKFVIATEKVDARKKLNLQCIELSALSTVE